MELAGEAAPGKEVSARFYRAIPASIKALNNAAMGIIDCVVAISTKPPFRPSQAAGLSVIAVEKATGQPLQYGLFAWVRGDPYEGVSGALNAGQRIFYGRTDRLCGGYAPWCGTVRANHSYAEQTSCKYAEQTLCKSNLEHRPSDSTKAD